jgi:pSer/pThr/pTyr-binding forkhead associated (FHA) protein
MCAPADSADDPDTPQDLPADTAWHARLRITHGAGTGTSFPLTAMVTTLGRHPGCDIVLDDKTVSRHHAAVHCHGDDFTLADAGSANGTYLNGQPVRLTDLVDGDEIEIGSFRLTFRKTHLSTREHQS